MSGFLALKGSAQCVIPTKTLHPYESTCYATQWVNRILPRQPCPGDVQQKKEVGDQNKAA